MAERPIEKIVFMGTPGFAVPALQTLIDEAYDIQLVVTQPNRPSGRGRHVSEPPVKELALAEGLEVIQPEHMLDKGLRGRLRVLNPDVIVVVAYGRVLPEHILSIPRFGCINVHSSLLPSYRGAAPINWAIINDEEKTGVTTMIMDAGLDTGPLLLSKEIRIEESETAGELTGRLALIGGELLKETLLNFNEIEPREQDEKLATYARILEKEDGHIDWYKDARSVGPMIRHHLWLIPTGEPYEILSATIATLSRTYEAPLFEPHVTVLGNLPDSQAETVAEASHLAEQLRPYEIRLTMPECRDTYFQCLYLRVQETPPVMEAHAHARSIFHRQDDPPYLPHLSLLYGWYSVELKQQIIAALPSTLCTDFIVTTVHVIRGEDDDPKTWTRLAEIPLKR